MEQIQQQEKEITISFDIKYFEKFALPILIIVSLVMLLWVTFNSNVIFGDESFHAHSSRWIAKNLEIPKFIPLYGAELYKLAYTKYIAAHAIFAGLFYAFGLNEAVVKFFVPFISVMTAIVIYRFVKNYFSEKIAYLSFFVFINMPLFLTYSVVYYSDVFLMFFLVLAIYFFFESVQKNSLKYAVVAGVFTALSILTKQTGIALLALFVLWFAYRVVFRKDLKMLKPLGIIVTLVIVLVSPWFIRNFVFFETIGCGYPFFSSALCRQGPEHIESSLARTPGGGGTDATLAQFGLLNFVDFSYSRTMFLFALIGLFYLLVRKTDADKFGLALFLIFVLFLAQQTLIVGTYRVEDFAREFLPSVIPLVVGISVFIGATYEILSKYHKILGIAFVIAIIYISLFGFYNPIDRNSQISGGVGKAETMKAVKQFVPGFYEGARWIRENTQPNANLLSLWTHQTVYTTERNSYWPEQQYELIFGTNNQTTVDKLKEFGFDYIFIQKWSIADGLYYQNYPVSFINFLNNNNETFTKTFENNEVMIYKVN